VGAGARAAGARPRRFGGRPIDPEWAILILSRWRIRLDITVPFDYVDEELERVKDELRQSAEVPGFRRGKAPWERIEAIYGRDMRKRVGFNLAQTALKAIFDHPGAYLPIDADLEFAGMHLSVFEHGRYAPKMEDRLSLLAWEGTPVRAKVHLYVGPDFRAVAYPASGWARRDVEVGAPITERVFDLTGPQILTGVDIRGVVNTSPAETRPAPHDLYSCAVGMPDGRLMRLADKKRISDAPHVERPPLDGDLVAAEINGIIDPQAYRVFIEFYKGGVV